MNKKIKWGILGPGTIAHQFAKGLMDIDDAELYAIVSRSQEKADEFGDAYGVEKRYSDYQAFLTDEAIDVVYVATPHPIHKKYAMMCMEAGKAVLCEKPVAMNQKELSEMIDCAKQNNVFFMEAMWTRFLPAIVKVRELLQSNAIGEIKRVTAEFAGNVVNKTGRLYELALGGGSLLDIGVYTISFASMILGSKPQKIESLAYIGETGVDERASIILGYEHGVVANLFCGLTLVNNNNDAIIYGEKGYIQVVDFWHSQEVIVKMFDQAHEEVMALPYDGSGYNCEAIEVMNCLKNDQKESGVMPLNESLDIMKIMDQLRQQWGLKYPME
jgi:predicted dehydrogenase